MSVAMSQIKMPFVVFMGDAIDPIYAKTGLGMVQWRPKECLGQIRLFGSGVDAGVAELQVGDLKRMGAKSLIIGCAAVGGGIPANWVATLREVAKIGIDIVAGLHIRLASLPGLAEAASSGSASLIDVRVPPSELPVGTGQKRAGRRLLTVGTDCACGKKYTALAVAREMRARGIDSTFRATGQTGIMIAGTGIPLDAVVADFLTGAAEALSPENTAHHWDVVEGQGSIFHPGFLQVTIGLLVGSQPDAFIVCHDPARKRVSGWPQFALPSIENVISRTIEIGALTNPGIRCIGLALNTSKIPTAERRAVLNEYAAQTNLPCVDPIIDGVSPLLDRLAAEFPS